MGIIGIDVVKGVVDVVLIDDNFLFIVKVVEEGRNIYCNIKKLIFFLFFCNFGEIIVLFLVILFGWVILLWFIYILWVNLIIDILFVLLFGVDFEDLDVMKEKLWYVKESLFSGSVFFLIFNGVIIGFLMLIVFIVGVKFYIGDINLFFFFLEWIDDDVLLYV